MLDIFDILGPVMVGPSSSHTAGAVRIGNMARTLLGSQPVKADIGLHGSFAETGKGHGTDRALVAGLLGIEFTVFVLMIVEAAVGKAGFQISFALGLAAVALVGALGIGAGLLPALRAMKIKPVEAMREE